MNDKFKYDVGNIRLEKRISFDIPVQPNVAIGRIVYWIYDEYNIDFNMDAKFIEENLLMRFEHEYIDSTVEIISFFMNLNRESKFYDDEPEDPPNACSFSFEVSPGEKYAEKLRKIEERKQVQLKREQESKKQKAAKLKIETEKREKEELKKLLKKYGQPK